VQYPCRLGPWTTRPRVAGMEARVKGKLKALLDERELIMDILGKLRSAKLSASKAMGMVQKSLAQCSICKAWRGLVPSARGRGGDSVASSFALASTLEGGQVTAILREILDDLNARRALYEQMLSEAWLQVLGNEKKLSKWTQEASDMAARVYGDEKRIHAYSRKRQELAGTLSAKLQAAVQGKEFVRDEEQLTERHCQAIHRILRHVSKALAKCPGGAQGLGVGSAANHAAAPSPAGGRASSLSSKLGERPDRGIQEEEEEEEEKPKGGAHGRQREDASRVNRNFGDQDLGSLAAGLRPASRRPGVAGSSLASRASSPFTSQGSSTSPESSLTRSLTSRGTSPSGPQAKGKGLESTPSSASLPGVQLDSFVSGRGVFAQQLLTGPTGAPRFAGWTLPSLWRATERR